MRYFDTFNGWENGVNGAELSIYVRQLPKDFGAKFWGGLKSWLNFRPWKVRFDKGKEVKYAEQVKSLYCKSISDEKENKALECV